MSLAIGTRGSALALAQARLVAEMLGGDVRLEVVRTTGDVSQRPIAELGDGAFVVALEEALRSGRVDIAVHSLKDLPTEERPGLVIAAVPARGDPRDALVTRTRAGLASLPHGGVVGTSSPRRAAFLRAHRPDAFAREIRGNVDTRLRKVERGEYDAVLLAAAGLARLGIALHPEELLPAADWPPAPGQGALAIQCRADDEALRSRLAALDDRPTSLAVAAERALLRRLGASCALPLGALAHVSEGRVVLEAAIATPDGIRRARAVAADPEEAALDCALALEPAHV